MWETQLLQRDLHEADLSADGLGELAFIFEVAELENDIEDATLLRNSVIVAHLPSTVTVT